MPDVVVAPDLADTFEADVIEGLTRPVGRKSLPPKHLYDERGSELFEKITRTEAYYPTSIEAAILEDNAAAIAGAVGPRAHVVEPGAGDGSKGSALLKRLDDPATFAPFEISEEYLRQASERIAAEFPSVNVRAVCADFNDGLDHLHDLPRERRVIFFPGSTYGNIEEEDRIALLRTFARYVGPGGMVLAGIDLAKDEAPLLTAYDDPEGVSAAFALNVVDRINRELDAGLDPDAFRYVAEWSATDSRITMAIEATREQRAEIGGRDITLEAGERIRTEYSHKFTRASIADEASRAGLTLERFWTDEKDWFSVCLLRA